MFTTKTTEGNGTTISMKIFLNIRKLVRWWEKKTSTVEFDGDKIQDTV